MKANAETMLRRLVAVQSDSGTAMECALAETLAGLIGDDPYFKANPGHWGAWNGGDSLDRPVVWALKKGSGRRTLVLSGHYDAVSLQNYGPLAHLACNPDALMAAMRQADNLDDETRRDLESGDWLFGRGTCDMKAGVAVNLKVLFDYVPGELNLLFTAVPDEENLSEGARLAARLYRELRERFGLDYVYCAVTEPSPRNVDAGEGPVIQNGSAGKILPTVMVRGLLAHGARSMAGLNAAALAARITSQIELNTGLTSRDKGVNTQPPTVQIFRDMKELYDVSMPEYCGIGFNLLHLKNRDPFDLREEIRRLCEAGLREGVAHYGRTFDEMTAAGLNTATGKCAFAPAAYTGSQLEAMAKKDPAWPAFKAGLVERLGQAVKTGAETLQSATMKYLMAQMAFLCLPAATAAVGLAPPYYPSTDNDTLGPGAERVNTALVAALAREGITVRVAGYTQGVTDLSYMSCDDPAGARRTMANIPMRPVYDIDFDTIAEVGFPTVLLGPGAKGIHQAGERVYLPDVREGLPHILERLIDVLQTAD